jgi:predicted GNAT family N-acyltransferase
MRKFLFLFTKIIRRIRGGKVNTLRVIVPKRNLAPHLNEQTKKKNLFYESALFMKIIAPELPAELEQYYRLRYEVLRQPWQQPAGSERANDDDTATHAMLIDENGQPLGVGRLHRHSSEEAQIRFMAIRPDQQGKGLGDLILKYLETIARQWQVKQLTLQARENALNFYRRNGFKEVEKSYLLFGEIQHYKMAKILN